MVTVGFLVRQSVLIAAEMRARKNSLNALYRVFFHCSIIMPVDVGLLLSYSVCYKDRSQRYSDAVCYRARLLPTTSWFMQMAFPRLKRLAISLPTGSLRITLWSRSLDQICMLKWVPVFVYHCYHSLRLGFIGGGIFESLVILFSPTRPSAAPPGSCHCLLLTFMHVIFKMILTMLLHKPALEDAAQDGLYFFP